MFENIKRLLAPAPPAPEKQPTPTTQIVGGGTQEKNEFVRLGMLTPEQSHMKNVKSWRKIYRRGGPAAACCDTYPQFVMSNGYSFCCDDKDEALKERVEEWADQPHVNFESVLWQGVLDAIICGTAFQEIIPDSGQYGVWGIVPRDASSFEMVYDKYGRIDHYNQIVMEDDFNSHKIPIKTDALLSLSMFPVPGEMYGASLVERAYDDIMRDADMIESITTGVHRHGTAKNHVKIGQPGDSVSQIDMQLVKRAYETVGAKNDWITDANVEILAIDTNLTRLDAYSNITLQRMAAAFGVPDELLGLGRGSTEATASVRIKAFYGTVTTLQNIVARTYSQHVLDRITGVPGSVWLEFNEVNGDDFTKLATSFAALRQGMNPDAVVPADWAREQLGIPADENPLQQGAAQMDPKQFDTPSDKQMNKKPMTGENVQPVNMKM